MSLCLCGSFSGSQKLGLFKILSKSNEPSGLTLTISDFILGSDNQQDICIIDFSSEIFNLKVVLEQTKLHLLEKSGLL